MHYVTSNGPTLHGEHDNLPVNLDRTATFRLETTKVHGVDHPCITFVFTGAPDVKWAYESQQEANQEFQRLKFLCFENFTKV